MGRWIRRGGFYPDRKLRSSDEAQRRLRNRKVHEDAHTDELDRKLRGRAPASFLPHALRLHRAHERYSSLGAQMVVAQRQSPVQRDHIVVRPLLTFIYNYSSASAFSMAAGVCCCTSTIQSMFRGNTPRRGNFRANRQDEPKDCEQGPPYNGGSQRPSLVFCARSVRSSGQLTFLS